MNNLIKYIVESKFNFNIDIDLDNVNNELLNRSKVNIKSQKDAILSSIKYAFLDKNLSTLDKY